MHDSEVIVISCPGQRHAHSVQDVGIYAQTSEVFLGILRLVQDSSAHYRSQIPEPQLYSDVCGNPQRIGEIESNTSSYEAIKHSHTVGILIRYIV